MGKEIWKDIKGFEGFYQVSNRGNVRSLKCRRNLWRDGERVTGVVHRVKNMTPSDNGKGYLVVNLKENNKRTVRYVHRLVAEHFLEKPEGKDVVNHLDYNIKNNSVDNLEWTTQKQNVRYSIPNMKHPRENCKPTNTGEKYITCRIVNGNKIYRVKGNRTFRTLEDAIKYRNEVLCE